MFLYKQLAEEWDKLNSLSKEEALALEDSIEDAIYQGCNQFAGQLMDNLIQTFPETDALSNEEILKIKEGISNALFSGYLIYVAYQRVANIARPKMRRGIQYIPTLMNEYNNTIAPEEKNIKSLSFNNLLDTEPVIEMLIERVANIELNILRRHYPQLDELPFRIGYSIRELLGRGVFIGFGLGYTENNLRT